MLEQAASDVPVYLRATFLTLGRKRLSEAARQQQGCRFLEELMLDTVLEERRLCIDLTEQLVKRRSSDAAGPMEASMGSPV